jgi:hypothetical protein
VLFLKGMIEVNDVSKQSAQKYLDLNRVKEMSNLEYYIKINLLSYLHGSANILRAVKYRKLH